MANQMKQLLAQADLSGAFGETFYMVDPDYRTGAQGWFQADGTGPMNLWSARNPNRVFLGAGTTVPNAYPTDEEALQAAIDALVDFRGDQVFFTPGSYTIAAATSLNVPDARYLGDKKGHGYSATVTCSASGALDMTGDADRNEVAYLRFVNPDSGHVLDVATGAAEPWFHNFTWDEQGTTANAANQFALVAGTWDDGLVENFTWYTGGITGPMFEFDGTVTNFEFRNFTHIHAESGLLPIALLDVDGAGSTGIMIDTGRCQVGAGGTVTALVDIVNMTAASTNITISNVNTSVGYASTTTFVTTAGAVNDIDLVNCWIATVEGGAGRAAIVGTA